MTDLATLVIAVDATQAKTAGGELDRLAVSGGRAETAVDGVGASARRSGAGLASASSQAALLVARYVSVAAAAVAVQQAVAQARAFGDAMAEVSTLVDTAVVSMADLNRLVLEQSQAFGSVPTEQAAALYKIISAGASDAASATEVLTAANRLAVAGVTDVATAAGGLTAVMNAYGDAAGTATEISDAMFLAVRSGQTKIEELSASVGNVAPLAAQLGVSFDELAAATAALTKGGMSTSVAMNGIRAIMAAIASPTGEATEMAKQLGIEFNVAGLQAKGLSGFMTDLVERTGGSQTAMAELFGGVEALVPALALATTAGADMNVIMGDMATKAGATQEAFDRIAGSAGFQIDQLMATISVKAIELGTALLQVLVPAIVFLNENFEKIIDLGAVVLAGFAAYKVGILLAAAATSPFIATVATMTAEFGLFAGAQVAAAGATAFATTVWRGFTAVLAANPFGAVVVGITAIASALILFQNETRDARAETTALIAELRNLAAARSDQYAGTLLESRTRRNELFDEVSALELRAAQAEERYGNLGRSAQGPLRAITAELGQARLSLVQVEGGIRAAETAFNQAEAAANATATAVTSVSTAATGAASAARGLSDAERDRLAVLREIQRAEGQFSDAIISTLEAQSDSARIEGVRKELGEAAAAAEEARLDFQRQNPLAVMATADALARALGITRDLTEAERLHYDALIASADGAESAAAAIARRRIEDAQKAAAKRLGETAFNKERDAIKEAGDLERSLAETRITDMANLYETLFTDGVSGVWDVFKKEGLAAISQIAAQWTLALLSGQSGGAGANPLSAIGAIFGQQGAANDNGIGAILGSVTGAKGSAAGGAAGGAGGTMTQQLITQAMAVPGLGEAVAIAVVTHIVGEGIEKLTGLRFDAAAGIFGLLPGFAVGALKGAVKGVATIGNDGGVLGVTDSFGKTKFRDQAETDAASILDVLDQIAQGLGTDINSSLGAVSIGTRNGNYRVDGTGTGITKTGQGAIDFGQDAQAAMEYAIRNLIEDGILGPISEASKRILAAGGDLQKAIEKAAMIEALPKLLKERLDPLGYALDTIDEQFQSLADALREGGATAQQYADAEQLYRLEREDAIEQFGSASKTLTDYLQSLAYGSNSPLSIRQQMTAAESAFSTFESDIAAGKLVDQDQFTAAADALLGLSRAANGSTGAYFSTFDRVNALTQQAITNVGTSVPGEGSVVFQQQTASNTQSIATMMEDLTTLARENNELMRQFIANDNTVAASTFIGSSRGFAA